MTAHPSRPSENRHPIERVRPELKRLLTVSRVAKVTPQMLRATLRDPSLEGFTSLGRRSRQDPHSPPGRGARISGNRPRRKADDRSAPTGRRYADYTPRRFDPVAGELDLDFALHEAGLGDRMALRAQPGDKLGVGGPRGSFVVPPISTGICLPATKPRLPAIARRLEELPAGARALVVAEVSGPEEEQALASKAELSTF